MPAITIDTSSPTSPPGSSSSSLLLPTGNDEQTGCPKNNSSRRVGEHNIKKLIALALFFALILVSLFFTSATHDPLWWQHAGIDEHQKNGELHPTIVRNTRLSKQAAVAESQKSGGTSLDPTARYPIQDLNRRTQVYDPVREAFSHPVNGSAFLADYDVSSIIPLKDPPLTKERPKYLFNYMNPKTSKYNFTYVSSKPMVAWIPNFLSDAECDAIIKEASKTMVRSQVMPDKQSKNRQLVQEVRTSSQTWLSVDHPVTKDVVSRIFDITGLAPGSSEMLQVLRYEKGQKYDAHIDYFDPRLHGPQTTNRALTAYLYLSTVEEGGYTQFPRSQGRPPTSDYTSCKAGLKVRPVKGTIAVFYDMTPNGGYDDYSLHGACKPVVGTKWGGTLWLRVPTV